MGDNVAITTEMLLKKQFRYYSRQVKLRPTDSECHKKRIAIALGFCQNEPLIGALADYFFGCWHEITKDGRKMMDTLEGRLPKHVMVAFDEYINRGLYVQTVSIFATRFSVLVYPSMNVPIHRLFVGKDEARHIVHVFKDEFSKAYHAFDELTMTRLESEFFEHCIACRDSMSFMMAWFALSKMGYAMHEGWQACKVVLER